MSLPLQAWLIVAVGSSSTFHTGSRFVLLSDDMRAGGGGVGEGGSVVAGFFLVVAPIPFSLQLSYTDLDESVGGKGAGTNAGAQLGPRAAALRLAPTQDMSDYSSLQVHAAEPLTRDERQVVARGYCRTPPAKQGGGPARFAVC